MLHTALLRNYLLHQTFQIPIYTHTVGILYRGLGGAAPYYNNFGHMLFASNNTGFTLLVFVAILGSA
jgi:hypothetical protein